MTSHHGVNSKPPKDMNTSKSLDSILKEFLDAVDYTLEAPIEQADDADFFDRPFIEAKQAIVEAVEGLVESMPSHNGGKQLWIPKNKLLRAIKEWQ